jgi:hypothetical protein
MDALAGRNATSSPSGQASRVLDVITGRSKVTDRIWSHVRARSWMPGVCGVPG